MSRHDDLDAALDRLVREGSTTASPGREPLVEVAADLRRAFGSVGVPAAVEAEHLAMLTGKPVLVSIAPRARRRGRRMAMIGLAAAIALTAMSGTALAASQHALPGDALYSIKRASERISLTLHRAPNDRARLHVEFAEERLIELQALLAARHEGAEVDVGEAMRAYAAEIAHVEGDVAAAMLGRNAEALLDHINAQLDRHLERLAEIRDGKKNDRARRAIQDTIDRTQNVRARVAHGRTGRNEGKGNGKPAGTPGKGAGSPQAATVTPKRAATN